MLQIWTTSFLPNWTYYPRTQFSNGRIYLDQQHLSQTAKKKCEHDDITITRAMYSNQIWKQTQILGFS